MIPLLAGLAALGWGAADFYGGDATRGAPVLVVVAISELLGLVVLIPVIALRGSAIPDDTWLLMAMAAGVSVTIELSVIYLALSRGQAFITAPVGALGAAFAVGIGLVGGDPLNRAIGVGLVLALAGGAISAWSSSDGRGRASLQTLGLALIAAAAIAGTLTFLHAAGHLDPYVVAATEHASTGISAALVAPIFHRRVDRGDPSEPRTALNRRRPSAFALTLVAAAGAAGDVSYAAASLHGALSLVAAISSLYPVTTILLGALVRGHRAGYLQLTGIILALSGAVLLGAAGR